MVQFITYKEKQYPVWNLLKELHTQGKLTPAQAALCAPTMPDEELYDTDADPFEIHNLAQSTDPAHQAALKRLRAELEKWITETDDQGRHFETLDQLKKAEPRFVPALDWRPQPGTPEAAEAAALRANSPQTPAPAPAPGPFRQCWENFLRHVGGDAGKGAPYLPTLVEGAKAVQLADLAYRSVAEKRWIDVPELKLA